MKTLLLVTLLGLVALISPSRVLGHEYTEGDMESYGRHAAMGELDAVDKIDQAYDELYQNINYAKDHDRVLSNLALMNAAFGEIARSVKRGSDESDPAYKALVYATGKPHLAAFTASAFGTAAAAGHQPSLDVLLHYKEHGLLLASAVQGMIPVAAKNNQEAVDFLVKMMNDDSKKALWLMASEGLVSAANDGNADAKAALAKYAANSK